MRLTSYIFLAPFLARVAFTAPGVGALDTDTDTLIVRDADAAAASPPDPSVRDAIAQVESQVQKTPAEAGPDINEMIGMHEEVEIKPRAPEPTTFHRHTYTGTKKHHTHTSTFKHHKHTGTFKHKTHTGTRTWPHHHHHTTTAEAAAGSPT